jgi:hypothetical protein
MPVTLRLIALDQSGDLMSNRVSAGWHSGGQWRDRLGKRSAGGCERVARII